MAWSSSRARFEQAVHDSLPAALRLATRLTGRFETAEDVVQEAMLRASKEWRGFQGKSQPNPVRHGGCISGCAVGTGKLGVG